MKIGKMDASLINALCAAVFFSICWAAALLLMINFGGSAPRDMVSQRGIVASWRMDARSKAALRLAGSRAEFVLDAALLGAALAGLEAAAPAGAEVTVHVSSRDLARRLTGDSGTPVRVYQLAAHDRIYGNAADAAWEDTRIRHERCLLLLLPVLTALACALLARRSASGRQALLVTLFLFVLPLVATILAAWQTWKFIKERSRSPRAAALAAHGARAWLAGLASHPAYYLRKFYHSSRAARWSCWSLGLGAWAWQIQRQGLRFADFFQGLAEYYSRSSPHGDIALFSVPAAFGLFYWHAWQAVHIYERMDDKHDQLKRSPGWIIKHVVPGAFWVCLAWLAMPTAALKSLMEQSYGAPAVIIMTAIASFYMLYLSSLLCVSVTHSLPNFLFPRGFEPMQLMVLAYLPVTAPLILVTLLALWIWLMLFQCQAAYGGLLFLILGVLDGAELRTYLINMHRYNLFLFLPFVFIFENNRKIFRYILRRSAPFLFPAPEASAEAGGVFGGAGAGVVW